MKRCKHCKRSVEFDVFLNEWVHHETQGFRCNDADLPGKLTMDTCMAEPFAETVVPWLS